MFKWYKLLLKIRDIVKAKLSSISSKNLSDVRHSLRSGGNSLYAFLEDEDIHGDGTIHPRVICGENKYRVTGWILYWPFSVVNYIFGKLLQDILDAIIKMFRSVYHGMADMVFKDIRIEIKK
jgi:hypothetical protein